MVKTVFLNHFTDDGTSDYCNSAIMSCPDGSFSAVVS